MGNKPSNNETIFIDLIKKGYLEVDENNKIWRIAKKHYRTKNNFVRVKRCRAEHVTGGGYLQLRTSIEKVKYSCMAHRVIWVLNNSNIPDGLEINHKNGIKNKSKFFR